MAVKFQDYYQTLGVTRDASAQDIQRAYRKLARQYHPDVNKAADAAAKFNELNEAYEVLKDPEKRKRYDQLGADWKAGQEFTPPPGFEGFQFHFGGNGSGTSGFSFRPGGGTGAFSDFFESLFGGQGPDIEDLLNRGQRGRRGGARMRRETASAQPAEQEAELTITLEEAFRGGTRQLNLSGPDGQKRVDVRIPAGSTDGSRIRLRGENLLLRLRVAPHPRFTVKDHDLATELPLAPWEAALGTRVPVQTMDGEVTLTVPPGTSSGGRLRLRGKGMPRRDGERGDLLVQVRIVVPRKLSHDERELFEQLREKSKFQPRDKQGG